MNNNDASAPKHANRPEDSGKKPGIDIDDAQLDDVVDDRAFENNEVDEEITDENQRSESRVEPRRPI